MDKPEPLSRPPDKGRKSAKPQKGILLWMNGGPSHIDTFDPKPGTATGGEFKAIKTSARGVQICEHLPHVAEQAKHLAVASLHDEQRGEP